MGKIGGKYRNRARKSQAFSPEMIKARIDARRVMRVALRRAVQEQLYDRTSLKVTRAMYRAVVAILTRKNIDVGFDLKKAPHVTYRMEKQGPSKLDGHDMTLDLKPRTDLLAFPRVRYIMRRAKAAIFDD